MLAQQRVRLHLLVLLWFGFLTNRNLTNSFTCQTNSLLFFYFYA